VSDWRISRIGTRMSGRLPDVDLARVGQGFDGRGVDRGAAERNFGSAFIGSLLVTEDRRSSKEFGDKGVQAMAHAKTL
jgi:hypothetical protein